MNSKHLGTTKGITEALASYIKQRQHDFQAEQVFPEHYNWEEHARDAFLAGLKLGLDCANDTKLYRKVVWDE